MSVEVFLIPADLEQPAKDQLDPNTEAIAKVSGAMLARGTHFHVWGDEAPFGIEWQTFGGTYRVSAGGAIVRIGADFYPASLA